MSDDNAWDPKPMRRLNVLIHDADTGARVFGGTVQATVAQEALSAALGAAERAWVPPSARPVSDGLYTAPGGLPEAIQAVAEAFIDAIKDDHPVLRVTVVRVPSL